MSRVLTALVVMLAVAPAAAVERLAGSWELQVMGSADRAFSVEHEGNDFSAYRKMRPEFEGKRYLLEHLYKGQIKGRHISGNLLVREEPDDGGEPLDFEVLRPFTGEILPGPVLVLDGKRARRVATPKAKAPTAKAPARVPAPADPEPLDLSRLTPVAGPALEMPGVKVKPDLRNPAQDRRDEVFAEHVAAGDKHAARNATAQALLEYLAAYKADKYKVGVYERIAETAEKRGKNELARSFWRKLVRFDPENTKARKRLEALGPASGAGEGAR